METVRPLTTSQQRLLQNLLACHVSMDRDLQKLWDDIRRNSQNEYLGRDLKDTLGIINRSLKPAFGLEIRSVSLSLSTGDENGGDSDINNNTSENLPGPNLYHAVVNCTGDKVSKAVANPEMTKNPHELALFRLIIERLVEISNQENSDDGGENNSNDGTARKRRRRGTGCQASLTDMAMINMRTELTGLHLGKLSIDQVQNAIELFVSQGWFVTAENPNANPNSEQRTPSSSRKKKKTRYLQLGPRSYLEFSDFLRKAGMDQELSPQFLVYS